MSALEGSVLTPEGWVAGRVVFSGQVERVEGEPTARPAPPFVLPGFVDLHVHGGGGADMMGGAGRHPHRGRRSTPGTAPRACWPPR